MYAEIPQVQTHALTHQSSVLLSNRCFVIEVDGIAQVSRSSLIHSGRDHDDNCAGRESMAPLSVSQKIRTWMLTVSCSIALPLAVRADRPVGFR